MAPSTHPSSSTQIPGKTKYHQQGAQLPTNPYRTNHACSRTMRLDRCLPRAPSGSRSVWSMVSPVWTTDGCWKCATDCSPLLAQAALWRNTVYGSNHRGASHLSSASPTRLLCSLGCFAALSADLSVLTGSTNVWSRPKNFLMGEFSLYLTPGGGYPPRLCG